MNEDIQKIKEEKRARKKENRRKRKWKKTRAVWKKMLPWLGLVIVIGALLAALLRWWLPHYDDTDVSVKEGRVVDIYHQETWRLKRYGPQYQVVLVFEDGFQGYIAKDNVKDEFDYDRLLAEYEGETFIVQYTDRQNARAANHLVDIEDADGNSYLARADINANHRSARLTFEIIYGVIALICLLWKYMVIEPTVSA